MRTATVNHNKLAYPGPPSPMLAHPISIAIMGAVLTGAVWIVAALFSVQPVLDAMLLVALQTVLTFAALLIGAQALYKPSTPEGPGILFFLAIHVLVYYGLANVIPALLPEMRPAYLQTTISYRIPPSNMSAYNLSTLAALSMVCGLTWGAWIARKMLPLKASTKLDGIRRYQWLPRYRLLMLACGITLFLLLLGTVTYGIGLGNVLLSDDEVAALPLSSQLFLHGLVYCLPISPVLAAGAYVQASSIRQQKVARWLTIASILATVAALSIWRMRSHSMMAFVLPLALLAYTGRINFRRLFVPSLAIVVMIYFGVSFIRVSEFEALLSDTDSIWELSINDVVTSIFKESGAQLVGEMAVNDASYRTAGLEGVAALIQAQNSGNLELQWGRTIYSGYLQALPSSLRPSLEVSGRIKTAPSYFGIFSPGDWVTTLLAEFVLDFGSLLVFLPALFFGWLLCIMDRALLRFGQLPTFEGVLVLRLPFLLFVVSIGGSISEMTLMVFKATIGYAFLLLLIGWVSRLSGRPSATISITPNRKETA